MRAAFLVLAGISLVRSSPHGFSVTDDLLAYPQYQVSFSDSLLSQHEAQARLKAQGRSSLKAQMATSLSDIVPVGNNLDHDRQSGDQPAPPDQENDPFLNTNVYQEMILRDSHYLCSIPIHPEEVRNKTKAHMAAEEEAAELARATDRGIDLLQEMSGSCLHFVSGWWSYKFCHAESVKQFHPLPAGKDVPKFPPLEDPGTASYVLGRFGERQVNQHRLGVSGAQQNTLSGKSGTNNKPATGQTDLSGHTTTIQAKGTSSSRYLSQQLSGGTICDLTGAPRRIEVQFHCHPQSIDRIGWIKETSTCAYLMVVYTPRLCNDVAFLPRREASAELISCQEIMPSSPEAIQVWQARKAANVARAKNNQDISADVDSSFPRHPHNQVQYKMVGDISVGAQTLVGGKNPYLTVGPARQPSKKTNSANLDRKVKTETDANSLAKQKPIIQPTGPDIEGEDRFGRPEDLVAQLAHQHRDRDGGAIHKLTDEEMRNLNVDLVLAEQAMDELEQIADGLGWRLELFRNGEGGVMKFRMRGIINSPEITARDGAGEVYLLILDDDDLKEEAANAARDAANVGAGAGVGQGNALGQGTAQGQGQQFVPQANGNAHAQGQQNVPQANGNAHAQGQQFVPNPDGNGNSQPRAAATNENAQTQEDAAQYQGHTQEEYRDEL